MFYNIICLPCCTYESTDVPLICCDDSIAVFHPNDEFKETRGHFYTIN